MTDYCSRSDLYDFGLPRGAVPNPARLIENVAASSDVFTLDEHGFEDGDPVQFRAAPGGTIPSPLVEGTTYYAVRLDDTRFRVSATDGGSAVDLGAGERVLVIAPLPIAKAITWASRVIDDMLPAHVVPIDVGSIPPLVRMSAAELAALKLTNRQGAGAVSLGTLATQVEQRLKRWAEGVPIRGPEEAPPANLAVRGTRGYTDRRGWGTGGCLE